MVTVHCKPCGKETPHRLIHNTAYDLPGTHMAGTERYRCEDCKNEIYKHDPRAQELNLRFFLD